MSTLKLYATNLGDQRFSTVMLLPSTSDIAIEGAFLTDENQTITQISIPQINNLTHIGPTEQIKNYSGFKRIDIIDALKGYAIILVILGHVIAYHNPNELKSNFLFILIYSFHMPLLLSLSGYLAYGKSINPIWAFIVKKFKGLFIPYFSWIIIGLLIADSFGIKQSIFHTIFESLYTYTNLWFFPVLFFSFILLIFYVWTVNFLSKFSKNYFSILVYLFSYIIFMWILIAKPTVQGFLAIRWFSPFVLIGYFIAEYKEYIFNYKNKLFLISLFSFPILLPFWDIRVNQFAYVGIIHLLINFILALFGIILSYYVVRLLRNTRLYDFFVLCGNFSLEIYVTSNALMLLFQLSRINFWFGDRTLIILSGTMIILSTSLICSLILSLNETCSTFLFGRWTYKHLVSNVKNQMFLLSTTVIYIYIFSIFLNISKTFS